MSDETELRAAATAGNLEVATTIAIKLYGPELLGYLNALARDPSVADDLFAAVCEKVWRGLPKFAWDSSFRTWAYAIARNVHASYARTRKPVAVPIESSAIVAAIRTQTVTYMQTGTKDRLSEIREALDPDDQTLLILRVDRQLAWRDIAAVFGETPGDVDKRAATLRKRFERLVDELRAKLK